MNYYRKEGERQDTAAWVGGRSRDCVCQEGSLLPHWVWGVEKALAWAAAGHAWSQGHGGV